MRRPLSQARWPTSLAGAVAAHAGVLAFALGTGESTPERAEPVSVQLTTFVPVEVAQPADDAAETPAQAPPSAMGTASKVSRMRAPTRAVPSMQDQAPREVLTRAPSMATNVPEIAPPDEADRNLLGRGSGASDDSAGAALSSGTPSGTGASSTSAGSSTTRAAQGFVRSADTRARLRAGVGCNDLFPYEAQTDAATVVLSVVVSSTGQARSARVVQATPAGQGFSAAGQACARRFVFSPARAASGVPVTSEALVKLKFSRSG